MRRFMAVCIVWVAAAVVAQATTNVFMTVEVDHGDGCKSSERVQLTGWTVSEADGAWEMEVVKSKRVKVRDAVEPYGTNTTIGTEANPIAEVFASSNSVKVGSVVFSDEGGNLVKSSPRYNKTKNKHNAQMNMNEWRALVNQLLGITALDE